MGLDSAILMNTHSTLRLTAAALVALAACSANAQLKLPRAATTPAPAAAAPADAPSTSPSPSAEKELAGKLAAAGWLVLLDRRDWGRAWETSSNVFRTTVPLERWLDAIPKVREQLGNVVDRVPGDSMYKTQLEGRPKGEYVTSVFDTKFGNRQVQELVTTELEADGRWRVTGYLTR